MQPSSQIQHAFQATKILLPPKHLISTFGSTTLEYVLVSEIAGHPEQCRIREGHVIAEKPKILTADFWKQRFEGFGEDNEQLHELMDHFYGDSFRSLEYGFKNHLQNTSTEHSPILSVVDRISTHMKQENPLRKALVRVPDPWWTLSLMRLVMDTSTRSFPGNVRELDERGFFHPEQREEQRLRHSIEQLFQRTAIDASLLNELSQLLRSSGLFSEYEDRFFSLVRQHRKG